MNEEFQAVYENGVLRLEKPLSVPDHARVSGVLTSIQPAEGRPELLSLEEFDRLLDEFAMPLGGTLPPDFSREDIYFEHD